MSDLLTAKNVFGQHGLCYTEGSNGLLMFRHPEYPKCDYFVTKGTWMVCGEKIVTGKGFGPTDFVAWYQRQRITEQSNQPLLDEAARVTALEESLDSVVKLLEEVTTAISNEHIEVISPMVDEGKYSEHPWIDDWHHNATAALANADKIERKTDGK